MPNRVLVLLAAFTSSETTFARPLEPAASAAMIPACCAMVQSAAQRLGELRAAWEIRAATSGDDAAVLAAIDALDAEARALATASPQLPRLALEAQAIAAVRERYRAARGLDAQDDSEPTASVEDQRVAQVGDEDAPQGRAEEEIIAASVRVNLSTKNDEGIRALGARAVPHLAAVALEMDPANIGGHPALALDILATMDTERALDVAAELALQPSFLVRSVVARTLSYRMLFLSDNAWQARADIGAEPRKESWRQMFELLLSEPAAQPEDLNRALIACALRGYLPRGAVEFFLQRNQSDAWPKTSRPAPGARPLYEAGLHHPAADIRRLCLDALMFGDDVNAALALHADPDLGIRRMIASQLLAGREIRDWSWPTREDGERRATWTDDSPELRAAFRALLNDEDSAVVSSAQNAFLSRAEQLGALPLSPATVLDLVAKMSTSDQRGKFLRRVIYLPGFEPSEELLTAVLRECEQPESSELLADLASRPQSPAFAAHLLATLEEKNDFALWSAAFGARNLSLPKLEKVNEWLERLDFDGRVRALTGLSNGLPGLAVTFTLVRHEALGEATAWRTVVLDAARPAILRMCAVRDSIGAEQVDSEHLAAIIRAAGDGLAERLEGGEPRADKWNGALIESIAIQWIHSIESALFHAGADGLALRTALFADPRVPQSVLLDLNGPSSAIMASASPAAGGAYLEAVATRLTEAIAQDDRRIQIGFAYALEKFGRFLPSPRRETMLGRALASAHRRVRDAARTTIVAGRDASHLELLRQATLGPDSDLLANAEAAASFLSDDAAALILDVSARTTNSEERAKVLAALEQITTYLDALARWERRTDAATVRVNAIAELVNLAEDASLAEAQRAEALRGLGLLGAVEELPRLVRALGSRSEAMRKAARAALDRLEQTK